MSRWANAPPHIRRLVIALAFLLLWGWVMFLVFFFPVYWGLEDMYRAATSRELRNYYAHQANALDTTRLHPCQYGPGDDSPEQIQFRELSWTSDGIGLYRRVSHRDVFGVRDWISQLGVPFFRKGYAIADAQRYKPLIDLLIDMDQACYLEPSQTADIYPKAKILLLEKHERFQRAIADYEAIRLPFGILMWGALVVFVGGLAVTYLVKRDRLHRLPEKSSKEGSRRED